MRVVIAHGASGKAASMQAHVDGLRERSVDASAIDLPLRKAEAAVPVYLERVQELQEPPSELIISGQSYGGRVASLLAAGTPEGAAGLVCFSYPLHRPGQPDWEVRSSHWPSITMPVLFLSGESDPFARIDLLEQAIAERMPAATLATYPKTGHSLKAVLADALDRVAEFVRSVDGRASEP